MQREPSESNHASFRSSPGPRVNRGFRFGFRCQETQRLDGVERRRTAVHSGA